MKRSTAKPPTWAVSALPLRYFVNLANSWTLWVKCLSVDRCSDCWKFVSNMSRPGSFNVEQIAILSDYPPATCRYNSIGQCFSKKCQNPIGNLESISTQTWQRCYSDSFDRRITRGPKEEIIRGTRRPNQIKSNWWLQWYVGNAAHETSAKMTAHSAFLFGRLLPLFDHSGNVAAPSVYRYIFGRQ